MSIPPSALVVILGLTGLLAGCGEANTDPRTRPPLVRVAQAVLPRVGIDHGRPFEGGVVRQDRRVGRPREVAAHQGIVAQRIRRPAEADHDRTEGRHNASAWRALMAARSGMKSVCGLVVANRSLGPGRQMGNRRRASRA